MRQLHDIEEWRRYAQAVRNRGATAGLVPTMGALHEGHAALIRAAKSHGDVVLLSIFVNPRQFNDRSDLAQYPRTLELDLAFAEHHGVDCVIAPSLEAMWPDYPAPTPTTVSVGGLSSGFEGAARPGHFDGVASVVAKLFAVTGPSRAYFGEKDYQQLAVVRQMVRDLGFAVGVEGCAIARDADGLALSSRNVRLSSEGRCHALALSRSLTAAASMRAPASRVRARMRSVLDAPGVEVDYAEVVDASTLEPSTDAVSGLARALIAATVEGIRLLDNGPVSLEGRHCDAASD